MHHTTLPRLLALAVAATLPQTAMAEAPAEDRIKQLEQIVQQMQQQRAEQDRLQTLDYVHTNFDTPIEVSGMLDDTEEALLLRAQYDFMTGTNT